MGFCHCLCTAYCFLPTAYWLGSDRGEMQGIPPTNRSVTMTGMAIYRLAGSKIVEEWMNTDTLGMLRQLGVIP